MCVTTPGYFEAITGVRRIDIFDPSIRRISLDTSS